MQGFLNLNKPLGFTSHDCVAKARRLLNLKRIGHAGTLDPAAAGVLPIAIGKATRLLQFLPTGKAYRATVQLGVQTSTDDLEGEAIATRSAPNLDLETVKHALPQFLGQLQQIPPNYSAIQVEGKRLYDLARAGKEIEAKPRAVEVFSIEVLAWRPGEFPEIELAIACGAGTYIRAIARDLGNVLGVGGTLAALTRTHSSGFDLSDSLTFEALDFQLRQGDFQPIQPTVGLTHLKQVVLPAIAAYRWGQGQKLPWVNELESEQLLPGQPLRIYAEDGTFLGIGQIEGDRLIAQVVYAAPLPPST